MSSWTWRQYAVFRALFGTYLLVHFIHLLPWSAELFSDAGMLPTASDSPLIGVFPNLLALADSPGVVAGLIGSGVCAAVLLMVGRFDRFAAAWLWFLLACLFGRNPLIANPSLPVVGWMLLFHALLPRQPKSTADAEFPQLFVVAAWVLLAVAYSYSGWTKLMSEAWVQGETIRFVLENPLARDTWIREFLLATPTWALQSLTLGILWLELLFAPLALVRRLRPWLWVGMLIVQMGFLVLLNFADLTTPILLIHLLTFSPKWLPARAGAEGSRIFYDGDCGLCHGSIRFVLDEDRAAAFRYAPMQGVTARKRFPEIAAQDGFESIIVVSPDGMLREKFSAIRYVLDSLGGLWRVAAWLLRLVPIGLGNLGYTLVAKSRQRWLRAPDSLCPIVPGHLAARFET